MIKIDSLNKKQKLIIALLLLLIALIIIGVSFAFYVSNIGTSAITDIDLNADISEKLIFTEGDPISLVASPENFNKGDGNLVGETTASVTYVPATEAVNTSQYYDVVFTINSNNYIYTVDENTPEIILEITDNNGASLTYIEGLNYVTVTDHLTGEEISGFDVTTFVGTVVVDELQQIVATAPNETIHEWKAKLTFVNLKTIQTANEKKELDSIFKLQKADEPQKILLSEYLITNHDETKGLIQHTIDKVTSARDNNYRYSGESDIVQNYVCFGSDEETCPKDNIYRILGIYAFENENLVKLIKYYPIDKNNDGNYHVDFNSTDSFYYSTGYKEWEGNDKDNTNDDSIVNTYLNNDFYNSFSVYYQNMIQENEIYTGSFSSGSNTLTANYVFNSEIQQKTKYKYKIGLMQASDFMYGIEESLWGYYNENYVTNINYNWMNNYSIFNSSGYTEWTLTSSSNTNTVWYIYGRQLVNIYGMVNNSSYAIRPVFYLKSNVEIYDDNNGNKGNIHEPFLLTN